jgi:hypothetical protein
LLIPTPEELGVRDDVYFAYPFRLSLVGIKRWRVAMRRFKWIEWNLRKINTHALSADEVEAAFDRVFRIQERNVGSIQMYAEIPSGRRIWVIWRYDREDDEVSDVLEEWDNAPIFVITAY